MKFDQLIKSSKKNQKRVGRGIAAGGGKTAGRGTKGQGARKSGGVRPGFEGGQMPLYMRIPKLRGFTSHREKALNVYTGQLNSLSKASIDNFALVEAGIIENPYVNIKVVVNGDLKKKLTVSLQGASKEAVKQIEKSGGKFIKIDKPQRKSTKSK